MQEPIMMIRERYREREDFHRAEKALTLRIKARCRRFVGGDKTEADKLYKALTEQGEHPLVTDALPGLVPFFEARDMMERNRLEKEKALRKYAENLPVWPFVDAINGFGALGLSIIVGIAGDLSNYANPAKLWKRFGLAVIDGKAQHRTANADEAIIQGYSPQRRSAMWTIGDSLIKKQNSYRDAYLTRKVYEQTKEPELTPMQHHRRAQRFMEKLLLKELWEAWRNN